jgi:hypothetical protein
MAAMYEQSRESVEELKSREALKEFRVPGSRLLDLLGVLCTVFIN